MLLGKKEKSDVFGVHGGTLLVVIIAMFFVAMSCASAKGEASNQKMMQLIEQLDQLDKMDFEENLQDARNCIWRDDFSCAARKIEEARKYAHSSKDHELLSAATREMEKEQRRVKEELARQEAERRERERLAREAREAEERLAEARRRAREEAEERAREAEEEAEQRRTQQYWAEFDARQKKSWDDFMAGVNATNASVNQEVQRINRENERKAREQERRLREAAEERARQTARLEQQETERRLAEIKRQQQEAERRQREMEERRLAEERRAQQEQRERDIAQKKRAREEEKQRQEAEEAQARRDYLAAMKSGIRLGAKNCYGDSFVGGRLPSHPRNNDFCVDVYFTAYCPGQSVGTSGQLDTFTGFDAGCFGDGAIISKVSCDEKDLRIVVDRVDFCD